VFLDLRVKVEHNWRDKRALDEIGVPRTARDGREGQADPVTAPSLLRLAHLASSARNAAFRPIDSRPAARQIDERHRPGPAAAAAARPLKADPWAARNTSQVDSSGSRRCAGSLRRCRDNFVVHQLGARVDSRAAEEHDVPAVPVES
jgi:hypothetical protein